jgi:hypothetical protein
MNAMKTEEAGSRKKYLAPLIVIMLCLVALTGAAYAYTSTMTNTSNTVSADYLSIDLKGKGASVESYNQDVVVGTDSIIQFQDNFGYAGSPAGKTDRVTYTLVENAIVMTYHIRVESDLAGPVNLTVNSDDLDDVVLFTYNAVATKLIDKYTAKFKVGSNDAVAFGTQQSVVVNTDLEVQIILALTSGTTGPFEISNGPVGTTAVQYANAFAADNNNVFGLTFTAAPISA